MNEEAATPLDRLDHAALAVRDIPEAVEWYTSQFRCRVVYQDETWAMLEFANQRLAFVRSEQHPPHVAVLRRDASRFGSLRTHRDGTRSVYVRDPGGNTVEILEDRGGARPAAPTDHLDSDRS